jgi:dienelactone hydrolase
MGRFPSIVADPQVEYFAETEEHGLRMRRFRFTPLSGVTTYGTLVMPSDSVEGTRSPGMLCIHGTDPVLAHRNVLSPVEQPNRQYAIELARRGFVCMAVDQFGFGEGHDGHDPMEVATAFYRLYPDWSLDGVRLFVHQRAIDLLAAHAAVDPARLGCIGHSLGGRAAVYLAAFDPRIRACVPSTGLSPNATSVFRDRRGPSLSPKLDEAIRRSGIPPFEYQEMLALIAPRSVFLIEPWNDPYNPLIEPVFRCFEKARFVFQLCGVPDNLQILCHGNGHDTIRSVRNYAYAWLEEKFGFGE